MLLNFASAACTPALCKFTLVHLLADAEFTGTTLLFGFLSLAYCDIGNFCVGDRNRGACRTV